MMDRTPKIGDLIIQTKKDGAVRYGLVIKKWPDAGVCIQWPFSARLEHFPSMNIHNLRDEFQVIRNGVNIP